jgi:hypothetical protein
VTNGVAAAQNSTLANFFVAGDTTDRGGVRVATKNVDGDSRLEIVTGSGEGSQARIRVYRGATILPGGEPRVLQEIIPTDGTLDNGIFVG